MNINDPTVKLPSERSFGLLFTVVAFVIAASVYSKGLGFWALVCAIVGIGFLGVSLIRPKLLGPLNRIWYLFGLALGKIVSPVVLSVIFYLLISPVALVTRMFGRDELKLKIFREKTANTYWVNRTPPGPEPRSFENQF